MKRITRRIEEVLQTLTNSDILVVTELSRLGRSMAEVIFWLPQKTTSSDVACVCMDLVVISTDVRPQAPFAGRFYVE